MKKLVVLIVIFFGCGKSDEIAPEIMLVLPENQQVFASTQAITVKATITDNHGIHMVHLIVLDNSNGGHMLHFEDHFDGKTYELFKTFSPQAGKTYSIEIGATDHNGNRTTKQLTVSAN